MRLWSFTGVCLMWLLAACARTPSAPTPAATLQGYPAVATQTPAQGYPAQAPTQPAPANPLEPTRTAPPVATAVVTGTPTSTPTPVQTFIIYQDFEIVPAHSRILVGTEVVFLIQSASGAFHEPYSTDIIAAFDSGPNLGGGASYAFTFQQAGTVTILCGYHPGMRAAVEVAP